MSLNNSQYRGDAHDSKRSSEPDSNPPAGLMQRAKRLFGRSAARDDQTPKQPTDFGSVLGLIKAHAVLHQAQRERDNEGRIIATVDDYAAIYELVADLVSYGVGASVPQTVRETVEAVKALKKPWPEGVPQSAIKKELGLDKGTVSRRINQAIELGYLVDTQEKRGQPAKLKVGDPMPDEMVVLPAPELFADDRCSVAAFLEGSGLPELSRSAEQSMESGPVMIAAE